MKIDFAELHFPLFLGGKNHGLKLFNKDSVQLEYDRTEKELLVNYNGHSAIIPSSNVASMTQTMPTKQKAPTPINYGKVKPQASTPMDHVFADGPGKTRD